MLLLHEVHTVAGPPRGRVRGARSAKAGCPRSPKTDDARLLYYLKLAHGTGRAYHHVTITGARATATRTSASRDRVQRGDLRDVGRRRRRGCATR